MERAGAQSETGPVLAFFQENDEKTTELIELENMIFSLSDSTVAQVHYYLATSHWLTEKELLQELCSIIISAVGVQVKSVDAYVQLVVKLAHSVSGKGSILDIMTYLEPALTLAKTSVEKFMLGLIENGLMSETSAAKMVLKSPFNDAAFCWFGPEVEEFNSSYFLKRKQRITEDKLSDPSLRRCLEACLSDNWATHRERRNGKHPAEHLQAIREDNVGELQRLITEQGINPNQAISRSIYEVYGSSHVRDTMTLLQYAALHGAVHCFRFLVLNGATVDKKSLGVYAIAGNNYEIVRLCEENHCLLMQRDCLMAAIEFHHFALFTWIYENCLQSHIPVNSIEILRGSIEYCNFEVFAYLLINMDCNGQLAENMIDMVFRATKLRRFTMVQYYSSIVEIVRDAIGRVAEETRYDGQLFSDLQFV